jgi:hypothetical protein
VTDRIRDWLPLEAIAGDSVRERLGVWASAWSERWFPGGGGAISSLTATPGGQRADGDGPWTVHRTAVATRFARSTTARVVERALGVRFEGLVLSAPDRRLIADFSRRVAEDLAVSLEAVLDISGAELEPPQSLVDPWGPLGGATIAISDGRDHLLSVAVPLERMIRFCKAGLSSTPAASEAAKPMRLALGPTIVTLEANVGRAQLSLADLRGLAAGDIIVLDNDLEAGIELSLPSVDAAIARASLGETDGRVALTLQVRPH